MFYESAALIFVPALATPFGIHHGFGLLTQMFGLAWNVSTVLLVLSWRHGLVPARRAWQLTALFVLGEIVFVVTFALMYPGPAGSNYIVNVAGRPLGTAYLATYAVSMLVTKIMVVAICLPQRRHLSDPAARIGLWLVIAGSVLVGGFGTIRLLSGIQPLLGVHPERWEAVALTLHVVGASIYVLGIAFVEFASTTIALVSELMRYRRLRPLCAAARQQFPQLGAGPALTLREAISADRVGAQVVRQVVLLSDAATLAARSRERTVPRAEVGPAAVAAFTEDVGAAFQRELHAMLTAARRFDRLRGHLDPVEACYRCLVDVRPLASG